MRTFRLLDFVLGAFVAVLIVSNLASSAKIVALGPLTFDGGTLLFPVSYIFGDVLTEVYGYATARRVIWTGFGASALFSLTVWIVGLLPPEAEWSQRVGMEAYNAVLGSTARVVLASLIAYWCGSFANAFVLAKLKLRTGGRWLWTRTIGSTLVGELVDTALFVSIAFAGEMSGAVLWQVFASNYMFKVGVEVLFTPLTYLVVGALKRVEGIDAFDTSTDFNPFALRVARSM
ncbi:MAG: queuosine precursor transporter [Thermoflexales bacterium]|nr:queuosine precursor transporter [Thermoflexales bacterium]MCS7324717.1 queuosine precursor transporter [Thermoflexales bacterium]MCX7939142.1 queuosine precursor transporter [Thermoflexales bacterium]MDW8054070.1 queuosine precursor transporter [Anaerolineae bacterium]MDW8292595.1 queuosine precursor transporter [Anaerolineae bacterium]